MVRFIDGTFGHHLKKCTVIEYRYASHTVFKTQYHFIFIKKYRYPVLKGDMGIEIRGLIRQTCNTLEIEIFKDVMCKNHVHLLVSAPMNIDTREIMRKIKER